MDVQKSIKKVLNNAIILLKGNMIVNIFGLLSLAILTHSLGAEILGYYVLFGTFITIFDKLFNFQTWQAFIKFATDFQVEGSHHKVMMLLKYSFYIDLISLLSAFVVVVVLSDFFVSFFEIPQEYTVLLYLMAVGMLSHIFEISTGVFRLFDEFRIQAKIAVYGATLKLIIFAYIALVDPRFEMFIYALVSIQMVVMGMKFYYAKRILHQNNYLIKEVYREKIDVELMKKMKIFSFIVYNNFDVAVRMVSRQLDMVILGKLYGAEIVGIYKIAKEVANLIAKLTDPVYQAIYPEFARLLANSKKVEAKEMAKKISLYAGGAGLVFYGVFALFGEWAIGLVFGKEFLDAYYVTIVYFIAIFIAIINLPLVPVLHSKGLAKQGFWNQFWATIGYCIVVYPLILYFSVIGAAVAYIVFYTIWMILALRTINKHKVFI